ncbi:hypothetical protein Btru_074314 [Bulinus truncatus]|nr:hypothetical protein Btru_074314 [Bulinus truncatus]
MCRYDKTLVKLFYQGPVNVTLQQRPHIVVLAFNDAVNERNYKLYSNILKSSHKNPNGCPFGLTLFVSDTWTNYTQLSQLWLDGAEVAAFGKSGYGQTLAFYKNITKKGLLDEIGGAKENFIKKGRIPPDSIRGYRTPHFQTGGDAMFDVLKDYGFDYDSSLIVNRSSMDSPPSWPATLDYRWPFECNVGRCPVSNHSSFWEIPVHLIKDLSKKYECQYIDSCTSSPKDKDEAYQLMWDNYSPFHSTRTPFVFNLRSTWLTIDIHQQAFEKLMGMFIQEEVFVVTMSQLVDWMKNPTNLNDIDTFEPWSCNEKRVLLNVASGVNKTSAIALVLSFICVTAFNKIL